MKINATHHYGCTMEQLFELFSSKDYYVKKFAACGARNIEVVESEAGEGRFSITTEREVPADVPAVLRSFLGDWNALTQEENWEGAPGDEYYSDLEISSAGVPVEITGSMNLSAVDNGCVNDIEIDVKCGIPLVGKKLEQFVAADIEKTLAAEYDFTKTEIE